MADEAIGVVLPSQAARTMRADIDRVLAEQQLAAAPIIDAKPLSRSQRNRQRRKAARERHTFGQRARMRGEGIDGGASVARVLMRHETPAALLPDKPHTHDVAFWRELQSWYDTPVGAWLPAKPFTSRDRARMARKVARQHERHQLDRALAGVNYDPALVVPDEAANQRRSLRSTQIRPRPMTEQEARESIARREPSRGAQESKAQRAQKALRPHATWRGGQFLQG